MRTTEPLKSSFAMETSAREWLSGVGLVAGGKWSAQLFAWACSLIISRLLSPKDFGLVTMTTVFLGFLSLLAEGGIGLAVANLPSLTQSDIRGLNFLSMALALCGYYSLLL